MENKTNLDYSIKKEQTLTMSSPSFFGIIQIKPMITVGKSDMHNDPDVEAQGMKIAMKYEEDAGRTPEDISKENLGFDVRSTDIDKNIRYIEVKARAGQGRIAMSRNEWYQAHQLGDSYYLYVVWDAKTPDAKLAIIQNPAKTLDVEEEVVRYMVSKDEIQKRL